MSASQGMKGGGGMYEEIFEEVLKHRVNGFVKLGQA